jgi:hypothetical protein
MYALPDGHHQTKALYQTLCTRSYLKSLSTVSLILLEKALHLSPCTQHLFFGFLVLCEYSEQHGITHSRKQAVSNVFCLRQGQQKQQGGAKEVRLVSLSALALNFVIPPGSYSPDLSFRAPPA